MSLKSISMWDVPSVLKELRSDGCHKSTWLQRHQPACDVDASCNDVGALSSSCEMLCQGQLEEVECLTRIHDKSNTISGPNNSLFKHIHPWISPHPPCQCDLDVASTVEQEPESFSSHSSKWSPGTPDQHQNWKLLFGFNTNYWREVRSPITSKIVSSSSFSVSWNKCANCWASSMSILLKLKRQWQWLQHGHRPEFEPELSMKCIRNLNIWHDDSRFQHSTTTSAHWICPEIKSRLT